jgi:hypothetical protein
MAVCATNRLGKEIEVAMPASRRWKRTVTLLLLFGISFGYVEAAVVVYLRTVTEPARLSYYAQYPPESLFPILTPVELRSANHGQLWKLLRIEIPREAATLIMLAAVAGAVGIDGTGMIAAFVIAFGVWDIAFYGFLKLLIGWPVSLFTWDLLFLLPVPWSGPVLAPVIVSLSMIGGGVSVLRRQAYGRPVQLSTGHWAGVLLGGVVILLSFTWDYKIIVAGRLPHPYEWLLFGLGEAIGLGAFLHGLRQRA